MVITMQGLYVIFELHISGVFSDDLSPGDQKYYNATGKVPSVSAFYTMDPNTRLRPRINSGHRTLSNRFSSDFDYHANSTMPYNSNYSTWGPKDRNRNHDQVRYATLLQTILQTFYRAGRILPGANSCRSTKFFVKSGLKTA